MSGRLSGKVAIVTGAGQGIGGGIARVFASEGAKVLIADMREDTGLQMVERIKDAGGEASFAQVNVTKMADCERMASTAVERYGRIDIMCNNSGGGHPHAGIEDMTEEMWDWVVDLNLKGTFRTVKAVLPQMLKQGYGRILVTSSITGNRTCIPGLSHYAAAKAGINGFIKNVAFELASKGITVNGVEPGNILTELIINKNGPEYIKANEAAIPMGHLGAPEDIGHAMAFLASDQAGFVTGQTIIVDGGQILPESMLGMNR